VSENDSPLQPVRFFRLFLDTLTAEIGHDAFVAVLENANLPADIADPGAVSRYTSQSTAETYARIQKAMRVYYGRGARGWLFLQASTCVDTGSLPGSTAIGQPTKA